MILYLIRDTKTGLYHHNWDSVYGWVPLEVATIFNKLEVAEYCRQIILFSDEESIPEIETWKLKKED